MKSSSDSIYGDIRKFVVYGGQYGSEGKASAAEYLARKINNKNLVVIGENGPNSGHTCSLGSTRNIPATSYFAKTVVMGPDSVIEPNILIDDWKKTGKPKIIIHENAALLKETDKNNEFDVVKRISSTGSGSGKARQNKFIDRLDDAVIKNYKFPKGIYVLNSDLYYRYLSGIHHRPIIFECSQGTLLDINFGIYPYVTSRTTLPRAAVERNGLGYFDWKYVGVYRTYPIRTGGPSGPTGGVELTWKQLGKKRETATVTKRIRRVFEFSVDDFLKSIKLNRPDILMFTFLDYLEGSFGEWLEYYNLVPLIKRNMVYISGKTGEFEKWKQNP